MKEYNMNDADLKNLVSDTGRILLDKELVARTWGNISARKDEKSFFISPSGLGYENMTGEDVPLYNMATGESEGNRKPSSEMKIHVAAYKLYPDVNFVIHTHQDYATAVGLCKTPDLTVSEEEKEILGKINVAAYGLPGTDKLANNVEAALKDSKVVLMAHHGVLILGKDRDDAMKKAELLEEVCKREVEKRIGKEDSIIALSKGKGFKTQLDDMAQMIGSSIKVLPAGSAEAEKALNKQGAVLIEGLGLKVKSDDMGDREALKLLVKKAAIAKRYSEVMGIDGSLSMLDCMRMRAVYKYKYSKKKDC